MLRVAWVGTYVATQHDDHADVVGQGDIDIIHDQHLTIGEARVAADYGFTHQLGASLVIPVRFVSTSIRYESKATGEDVDLVMPGVHHRDETLVGLADPMALGSFTTPVGAARVVVRAGFSLPLGRTESNPFTAAAETTPHQHVQMGSGTFRPVIAADASYGFGRWRVGGFLFTQQSIYENSRGYKTGDRYAAGATVLRRLGTKWSLRGGIEVQGETAEHWNGVEHTDDGNRGRFDAMFSAGGSYFASDRLAVDATIKVPFVTKAVGGQLEMPAILEVGASWTFGPKPKLKKHHDHDHEHGEHDDHDHGDGHVDGDDAHDHGDAHVDGDHDHGDGTGKVAVDDLPPTPTDKPATDKPATDKPATDKPATDKPATDKPATDKPATDKPATDKPATDKPATDKPVTDKPATNKPATDKPVAKPVAKPDIAAVGEPGSGPDLVPVRGKVTIFDFWAPWCVPCRTLDPVLVELAKKYPDRIALRKLDVVDWDSKTAERYLTPGGFDLPHVKIFDANGKRIFEKSSSVGKLDALIAEIRTLVERSIPAKSAPR